MKKVNVKYVLGVVLALCFTTLLFTTPKQAEAQVFDDQPTGWKWETITTSNDEQLSGWRYWYSGGWPRTYYTYYAYTTQSIDGSLYHFDSNGFLTYGWFEDKSDSQYGGLLRLYTWYYSNDRGICVSNTWQWIDGSWYRFNEKGKMLRGWYYDSSYNNWFWLNIHWMNTSLPDGSMYTNRWAGEGYDIPGSPTSGVWYYFYSNGQAAWGWNWIDGWWYYFDWNTHLMYKNCWIQASDGWWWAYYNGQCVWWCK